MSDKLDIRDIVVDHFRTLVSAKTEKRSLWDYVLFLGLPLILACTLFQLDVELSREAVAAMINALAIFAGLLLNLLMLLRGSAKAGVQDGLGALRRKVAEQLYANIAYEILVTLVALILFLWMAIQETARTSEALRALGFFLVSHFLLTLFMVLKRVHRLMADELSTGK